MQNMIKMSNSNFSSLSNCEDEYNSVSLKEQMCSILQFAHVVRFHVRFTLEKEETKKVLDQINKWENERKDELTN